MKFDYDATYFNPTDVLECGQIFRFEPFREGYRVYSADKDCYVYTDGAKTVVESGDSDYYSGAVFRKFIHVNSDRAALLCSGNIVSDRYASGGI